MYGAMGKVRIGDQIIKDIKVSHMHKCFKEALMLLLPKNIKVPRYESYQGAHSPGGSR